jgi:iron complex outermembrane receptor protein
MTMPIRDGREPDVTPVQRCPLRSGIRRELNKRRRPLVLSTVLTGSLACTGQAAAQQALEEIIVTAQKREQSMQDVPVSVQVLGQEQLEKLNIASFDDFVVYAPSVSVQSNGPGQSQIYMRGVSDGGDGNFSGTSPSVALYLDEQPVTAISRNLDVHVYDMARIETLPGPQGTLYGANSQAGTIRIITNKPDSAEFSAGYDLGVNTTSGGDPGYSAEGFVNIPLGERAAARLVGWYVEDGGWIDAVEGSITFPFSGLTESNTGNSDPDKNTPEKDYNTLTNAGARAALGIDLNERWALTASVIHQQQQSDGVFADQPDSDQAGEGKVVRFYQDNYKDQWTQFGLTVNGDLGFADMTLAGSYLDRDVDYDIDYSQYSVYSNYVEYYYTCVNYDAANCNDPRIQYENDSQYKRSTVELRLQSQGGQRLDWVAGAFYTEDEHRYFNQWIIPTIPNGNDIPLDRNVDGREDLYFATNQVRKTSEVAAFGEVTLNFTDQFSGTLGGRWFQTEDQLSGFVGSRFSCFDPADGNRIGNGTDSQPDCGGGLKAKIDDFTWKLNFSYRFTEDFMSYVTYSEGFRPGGINREPSPVIPQVYQPDYIKNYEIGWKATLADGQLRFNGAAYYMDWEDLQLTRFDVENFGSFLGLTANTDGAEVMGVEAELQWLVTDGWNLAVAASYNQAELAADFFVGTTDPDPVAPKGTDLPFTPDFKFTIITSHDFKLGSWDSYARASYSWTDSSWNDLYVADRVEQGAYGILNASLGTKIGGLSVELYANNLTDEYAEILRYTRAGDNRVVTNRPRTIGLQISQRF